MTNELVADGWLRRKLTTVTVSKLRYSRDSVPLYAADNPAIKALVEATREFSQFCCEHGVIAPDEHKRFCALGAALDAALAPWVAKENV